MPVKKSMLRARYPREYQAWVNMRSRCNPNNTYAKPYYTALDVAADLSLSFSAFMLEVGPRPGDGYSLDRINNNLGYVKGNLRWATAKEQANNRRYAPQRSVQTRSRSGLTGVVWFSSGQCWQAYGIDNRKKEHLYAGKDFFEACCARKSWEKRNV